MFQLEQRYIVPQHGNTVRLLPSALPLRLTNEARGANRAAHERWDREIYHTHTHIHTHTHTHIYPIRTSLCRKMGGKTRESSSALLFKQPSESLWFLPFSLHMCHRSSQQVISLTRKRANAPDARVKILQKLIWRKRQKRERLLPGFLVLGRSEITVCIMPGVIACQTTRIKDLIVWITSLICWCHWVVLQVLMCQFFFSPLLLGRCSVRLVICFKCFLGNETRWNPAKRTLLSRRAFS